jgi:hypothetical protein
MTSLPAAPPCRTPHITLQCTSLTRADVPALSMWVRLVATARIPSSVTDEHSLRWSSVSAVRPATAQTFTLWKALTVACRAALVGHAVHQLM